MAVHKDSDFSDCASFGGTGEYVVTYRNMLFVSIALYLLLVVFCYAGGNAGNSHE
jgi:hypothetical protein